MKLKDETNLNFTFMNLEASDGECGKCQHIIYYLFLTTNKS